MELEETVRMLKELKGAGVKAAEFIYPDKNPVIVSVEFFDQKPMYSISETLSYPAAPEMPPDDVMLFAATEDPEEALRQAEAQAKAKAESVR